MTEEGVAYAVNTLNQYTTVTTGSVPATITHDQNGNLTGDGSNTFSYDAENRLLSVAMGGGANVSYVYDPIGRRARKTVDGTVTDYLHDGTHVIAEYDGSGNVLRRYVHGSGTDRPIAMVEGGAGNYTHSYYHADHLGSVVALTDDNGAPVAHYTYNAYGIPYLVDPGTGAQTQVAAGQPYLFTGRRFDFETGLYYYRARYYSASLGRFLQTDPIGYEDQMNLYAYVGNDPLNATDPTGEASFFVTRPFTYGGVVPTPANHSFVVVTDGDSIDDPVVRRFSFGPGENGELNDRTDIRGDATDTDDHLTMDRIRAGDTKDITVTRINASDETVLATGDAAEGHPKYEALPHDEGWNYNPPTGPRTRIEESANSNSAAVAIATRSAEAEGNTFQPPDSVWLPGAEQADNVIFDEEKLR